MSHVFISYKTEDREIAQRIRAVLTLAVGCKVWWDQHLQTGGQWAAELDAAVRDAGCVVVLWSERSVRSPWVLQEAAVAKALGRIVPARLDECILPAPYASVQTAVLANWTGQEDDPEFAKLAGGVRASLASKHRRALRPYLFTLVAALSVAAAGFGGYAVAQQVLGELVSPSALTHQIRQLSLGLQACAAVCDVQKCDELSQQLVTAIEQFESDTAKYR